MKKKKIAIIGSGISGLALAKNLSPHFEVIVLEKENRLGGHTHTINELGLNFDTGFMVYNEVTYPELTKFFKELDISVINTEMSFSVQHDPSHSQYAGSHLLSLFGYGALFFKYTHWKLLKEIHSFNKIAANGMTQKNFFKNQSIEEFCRSHQFSELLLDRYLLPMSAAVWSTPKSKMRNFDAAHLVHFFYNHGFLGLHTQHQWKTVVNGSQQYIDALKKKLNVDWRVGQKVDSIKKIKKFGEENYSYEVNTQGNSLTLEVDYVAFACHADQALKILGNEASVLEKELLSPFLYQSNMATIHQDESVMPVNKKLWSSWNYVTRGEEDHSSFVVYWMNELQHLPKEIPIFINIGGEDEVDPSKVIRKITYEHPLFNTKTAALSSQLPNLNRQGLGRFFCGSYFFNGFHEDGLKSALELNQIILKDENCLSI